MLDRILTIINGPIYLGCYRTAEFERRQFVAASILAGVCCMLIGIMIGFYLSPIPNM